MSCMKKPELIGPLLGYCNHRAYQRMEQKLRRYGVTPIQCRSLTYLHRQPGPVTQKQLQQHLAVKPSTVNGIVDRLVEKGMLTRTPGEKDGRCRILRLTEESLAPVACLEETAGTCPRSGQCRTLALWQGLDKVIQDYLESVTIADLIEQCPAGDDYVI